MKSCIVSLAYPTEVGMIPLSNISTLHILPAHSSPISWLSCQSGKYHGAHMQATVFYLLVVPQIQESWCWQFRYCFKCNSENCLPNKEFLKYMPRLLESMERTNREEKHSICNIQYYMQSCVSVKGFGPYPLWIREGRSIESLSRCRWSTEYLKEKSRDHIPQLLSKPKTSWCEHHIPSKPNNFLVDCLGRINKTNRHLSKTQSSLRADSPAWNTDSESSWLLNWAERNSSLMESTWEQCN
jgi:hypothetical protein